MDTINTDRLVLRPCHGASDVDAVWEAESESLDQLKQWFWWCWPEHNRAKCEAWAEYQRAAWADGKEWSALAFNGERFVGVAFLNAYSRLVPMASLGYWIRKSETRKGYAVEACWGLCKWGFNHLGLNRIEIVTAVRNEASQAVARKLRAKREGIARNRLNVGGQLQDAIVWSLLPWT